MRMRAGPAIGVALATAVLGAALPASAVTPEEPAAPAPCTHLGVIGDSLTVLGRAPLLEELAEVGITDVRVDARVSRRTTKGSTKLPSGLTALHTMRESGYEPDCFVIALGTNDLWRRPALFKPMIEQFLAEIGEGPRVLWVDVWVRPKALRDAVPLFDAALDEVATASPQLWVAGWSLLAEADRGLLKDDGIHQSERGRRVWARLVAGAVSTFLTGGAQSAPPDPGCAVAAVPVKLGQRSADVECLESRLHQLRYQSTAPTPRFSYDTWTALRRWQVVHGLERTGVLDAATRTALGLDPPA